MVNENFDSVTPPALPPDWVATNAQGPPPLWVTSNSGVPIPSADTPPNAAFIDDPAVVSDKRLDSLPFYFFRERSFSLTFRHNFNLEASSEDPNLGFDGGVLEISTDGGNTFQDILAAGGSFVMGGYNRTISTVRGSPIAGRQAWSGNSEGFITTVVNLPFIFAGDSRLRWRMASDTSGSSEGWRVDTVNIAGACQAVSYADTYSDAYAYSDSNADADCYSNCLIYAHGYAYCYTNGDSYGYPTITPRPTPTARPNVTPRSRPTPAPRRKRDSIDDQWSHRSAHPCELLVAVLVPCL